MPMTITEKILAHGSRESEVVTGQLLTARLDGVLANDITAALALPELHTMSGGEVFDKDKVYIVLDHFTPNASVKAASQCKLSRDFARAQGLPHFFDVGNMGIEHALLPEKGLVLPGQIIIGGDSHTCTYGALGAFSTGVGSTDLAAGLAEGELWLRVPPSLRFRFEGKAAPYVGGKDYILHTIGAIGVDGALYKAMEFCGSAIERLDMDGRFTMCNMAIEAGAKNGIMAPDATCLNYVRTSNVSGKQFQTFTSDADAVYEQEFVWNISRLEPQVSLPHLPSNARPVGEVSNITVDQVVIGSCTNGRLADLRVAATLLRGKKVHPYVRVLVIPATQKIYKAAMREGLLEIFIDAGAAVSMPTCGPCFGGHMGILAEGERAVSTTNRNFVGRMGHPTSEVYLSGPAVAAASAVLGRVAHPAEVL